MISSFHFSVVGGDGYFNANQEGQVTVANELNYESKSFYSFTIVVTEITPPTGLVANATINVKIEDVNEFNPVFRPHFYHANVSEGARPGTYVSQVSLG